MTMQELLDNTIRYYSEDINRRCRGEGRGCYYSPTKINKEGISEGCAIGRHLSPEVQLKFDNAVDVGSQSITTLYNTPQYFNLLPEWMKKMPVKFLGKIQRLHDNSQFWNEKGLTDKGLSYVDGIKAEFDLN